MTAPAPHLETGSAHLDCIHCGICLSVCPTYLQLGNEADSPRGRIYLMSSLQKGRLAPASAILQRHISLCLECRACETACPSGVRFSTMINEARAEIRNQHGHTARQFIVRHLLMDRVFLSRRLRHLCFRSLRFYQRSGMQRLVRKSGILKRLSRRLELVERLLPQVPKSPRYPVSVPAAGGGKVLLFEGCIMPELFGPVHEATVRVLRRNGISVSIPPAQNCCGALHLHDGDLETARKLARRNIAAFESAGNADVIVNAAGCGAALKEYGELLAQDPAYAQRALAFSRRVRDISEYLYSLGIDKVMGRLDMKAAYDDPCHLLHAQGIHAPPRNLLRMIPGLRLVELRDADRCCGSAGVYNITHPEMSARILDEKIANIVRSGAEVVVSGNPGCILQIEAGLRDRHLPVRVAHPVELLDAAYEGLVTRDPKCGDSRAALSGLESQIR